MIFRGLSVITCGHIIALDRDEATQTAQVTVHSLTPTRFVADGEGGQKPVDYEHGPPQLDDPATLQRVRREAVQLAQRAARCLGGDWCVRQWEPPVRAGKVLAVKEGSGW